ncbi:hypothetical protein [Sphingomonas sp. 28-63-12]|uniref:hypothetical protein n=1 Tax=Sphingomonas sp. 28-63-12 TaxID=1970434 RepID=UPI000BC5CD6B|nr:MAG: hypothetical protein B7Y47_13130 [Sphingomonas sp. 28-63-12]
MTDVDRQIARSAELLERTGERHRAGMLRRQRTDGIGQRVTRIALADGAILLATIIFALAVGPIGLLGAVGVIGLLIVVTLALAILPTAPAPTPERLREVPLKALPAQTERWLATQRAALPAPAITLIDQIGLRLDTLSPQLATLGEDAPAAADVRKLVGEQLPEFIKGYTRVPPELRRVERNGKTPDAQLIDGLRLIENEIGEMTTQLAEGDLDQLATRGRFLEIKYRGDSADPVG